MAAGTRGNRIHCMNLFRLFAGIVTIMGLLAFWGCGNSSDTKSAVKNATSTEFQAAITSPGSNVEIAQNGSLVFNTAPTGGIEPYAYAWNFPGGSPRNATGQSATVTFADKGVYTVSLTITDAGNNTESDTVKVTVTDSPALDASITSPARSISITKGDSVSFAGQATGGTGSYRYSWTIPGSSTPSSTAQSVSVIFTDAGTHTVIFTVTDSNGKSGSDFRTITVTSTSSTLSATITSPAGDLSTIRGASVSFSSRGTGGTLPYTYSWDIPGGSIRTAATQDVSNVTFTNSGSYLITLRIIDSAGATDTDQVTVSVGTQALSASITSPAGATSVNIGDSLSFNSSVTGGKQPYTYSWTFPSQAPPSSTSATPFVTFVTIGTYTVTLSVTDADGTTVSDSVAVTVN